MLTFAKTGLNFGRFFHKLIWSPWLETTFLFLSTDHCIYSWDSSSVGFRSQALFSFTSSCPGSNSSEIENEQNTDRAAGDQQGAAWERDLGARLASGSKTWVLRSNFSSAHVEHWRYCWSISIFYYILCNSLIGICYQSTASIRFQILYISIPTYLCKHINHL
jgi:hypothetical protein